MAESSDYVKRRFNGEVLNSTAESASLITRLRVIRSMLDRQDTLGHIQTLDLLADFQEQLAAVRAEVDATAAAFAAKLKQEPSRVPSP